MGKHTGIDSFFPSRSTFAKHRTISSPPSGRPKSTAKLIYTRFFKKPLFLRFFLKFVVFLSKSKKKTGLPHGEDPSSRYDFFSLFPSRISVSALMHHHGARHSRSRNHRSHPCHPVRLDPYRFRGGSSDRLSRRSPGAAYRSAYCVLRADRASYFRE